jgi:hypothetical protein
MNFAGQFTDLFYVIGAEIFFANVARYSSGERHKSNQRHTLVLITPEAISTIKVISFIKQQSSEIVGQRDCQRWIILHINNILGFRVLPVPVQVSADQ